ncbi:MAG TPA: TetR/AcrR family transcriptional regulator [Acidimicrobiales bacterium]|nr:TetR/AcrR family transcriptional regulator [Acidimicrobiales bacterium]
MVVEPTRDRRAERREATRAEILATAWELAREQGLAGLSLRDVATRVGLRPPSLYWYFASKHAIYDAMFAEGNRQLLALVEAAEWPDDPRELLRLVGRAFVEFGAEDPARAQLLFMRTIPDFEPSPESYAVAVEVLERTRDRLVAAGIEQPAHFDLWTALVSGLAAQQIANEPGGDRWLRLLDEAVAMYADHVLPPENEPPAEGTPR